MPTRSAENYIQLHKKITNRQIIKIVAVLSREQLLTPCDICYRFITEAALREIDKRERHDAMMREVRKAE